jgi:hypothetical protein
VLTATAPARSGADPSGATGVVQTAIIRTALTRPVDVAFNVRVVAALVAFAFVVIRVIAKVFLGLFWIELLRLAIIVVIVRTMADFLFLFLLLIVVLMIVFVVLLFPGQSKIEGPEGAQRRRYASGHGSQRVAARSEPSRQDFC